jgi:transglutaminase-like putative cysteine protease
MGAETAVMAADSRGLAAKSPRAGPVGMSAERGLVRTGLQSADSREGSGRAVLYLRRTTGYVPVFRRASCDTYQIYFHVPIPFHEQAPVLLQVTCPQMIDYRFVRKDPPNLLVSARLLNADSASLNWTSWVLVKENTYPGFPSYVPIPTRDQLPDSVRQWLDTTDCCQVSAPIVQFKADSIRDTTTNLIKLVRNVGSYCHSIPDQFPHEPAAFDAVYALKWGNSCTGHAHAAAALLRANGVPARMLLNIVVGAGPTSHWIIDYYVPNYGWVRMESTSGITPMNPQDELVVQASNPCDEFPVWHPCGMDAEWHSSDTALGMWNPGWEQNAYSVVSPTDSSERVDHMIALTDSVFDFYSSFWGIDLTPAESAAFQAGLGHQTAALDSFQAIELTGYLAEMQQALLAYQAVNPGPVETLYSEDFESGLAGWTHGGTQDEWELGVPTFGPTSAHSGANCWGTNLEGPYASNDDCWLASPWMDLSDLASANLSFWGWNSVHDSNECVYDPVWVEVSRDGAVFYPLTNGMGGVNDDPEIPPVGGWSHVFLDLVQYLGDTVQVRFHFKSDRQIVYAGSYIDDVLITGRRTSAGIAEAPHLGSRATRCLPTVVCGALFLPYLSPSSSLFSLAGRKVMSLKPGANDVSRLGPGVYFVREEPQRASRRTQVIQKVVITR